MPYACKFCIAQRGLKGSDLAQLPTNREEVAEHVEREHHYPVARAGETLQEAQHRVFMKYQHPLWHAAQAVERALGGPNEPAARIIEATGTDSPREAIPMSHVFVFSLPCCPDCKSVHFHAGPRGGLSINIRCAGCGECFNYCGTMLPSHRIECDASVYSDERKTIGEIQGDREEMMRSMRRTLALMEAMGVPKERLAEILELAAQEVRAELKNQQSKAGH